MKIEIWQPRYHDNKVLIAKYKTGVKNEIVFTKAKHLTGMIFAISGEKLARYPIENNGSISCYAVPLDDLERIN